MSTKLQALGTKPHLKYMPRTRKAFKERYYEERPSGGSEIPPAGPGDNSNLSLSTVFKERYYWELLSGSDETLPTAQTAAQPSSR